MIANKAPELLNLPGDGYNHRLKFVPEDFLVQEVLMPTLAARPSEVHPYFLLRKRGFTTFQAVRRLAEATGVDAKVVAYAGLKDEDAVTEQHISVGADLPAESVQSFNAAYEGKSEFIQVVSLGREGGAIRVGHLIGNAFRIAIRDLDEKLVARLASRRSSELVFINYYDTQRFGVPGGPKTTHLIGDRLHAGAYDEALALLRQSRAEEALLAQSWSGSAEQFFCELDPRIVRLYYAAYSSYQWNTQLADSIAGEAGVQELTRPPLKCLLTVEPRLLERIRQRALTHPLRRFSCAPGFPEVDPEVRPGLIQARIRVVEHGLDEFHQGRNKVTVEMFLPSGCYATMAINQFVTFCRY
ncbi:tRNA pseudouridine(13) synthase TruD (plasmid) [Mesorhizobium loti]|nr:tRNA pseudouridine(13) synthase TruD [Mesorhizobium loti]